MQPLRILFVVVLLFGMAMPVYGLEPDEVLVLANRNAAKSEGLARYYMSRRHIPEKNLLLLWMTDKESCSREDYEKKVVAPVRRYLEKEENRQIRCIVSMYGLPLKIGPELAGDKENPQDGQADSSSSFDSELTLVKRDGYDLNMWIPNPYFLGFRNQFTDSDRSDVLMTSRLDGPSEDIVKRIIDDAVRAEKEGLKGRAYFDARWPDPGDKDVSGYGLYDRSIHRAADHLERNKIIPVIKEETSELFQPGDCPDAALYCGWYRLANYLDAFDWQPGSVGYHIASSECQSLKSGNYWCVKMLEDGITATIGPVGEPYVQAFPMPEIFFKHLTEGYLTLAEAYIISLPYLSWKMVLVGDPLYGVRLK